MPGFPLRSLAQDILSRQFLCDSLLSGPIALCQTDLTPAKLSEARRADHVVFPDTEGLQTIAHSRKDQAGATLRPVLSAFMIAQLRTLYGKGHMLAPIILSQMQTRWNIAGVLSRTLADDQNGSPGRETDLLEFYPGHTIICGVIQCTTGVGLCFLFLEGLLFIRSGNYGL